MSGKEPARVVTSDSFVPPQRPAGRADTAFAVAVAVLFACVCGFAISYHEMWRDELQSWLIARSSSSLGEMRESMRYEGHPALWYLLLYGVTRLTQRPEAMQLLHVVITSACVFVFARSAPFPRWARLCFALGYFPLYEYGVVSRNYSIGILFLFAAAALLPRRRERPWLLGVLLALAAQANAMALIVAAAFAGTVFLEPWVSRAGRAGVTAALKTLGLTAAGVLLAAMYVAPPADTGYADAWVLEPNRLRAERILGLFAKAMVLPTEREGLGDLWAATGSHHVAPLVSIVVISCMLPWLLRRKVALIQFAAGTSLLLMFFYTKLDGSLRHHGFLFVNVVLALWYAEVVRRESAAAPEAANAGTRGDRLFLRIAAGVLFTHMALAAVAVWQDVSSVFSAGRATAEMLVASDLDELPIVADPDAFMTSVLGYLPQRTFYYPRGSRFGSFTRYDKARIDVDLTDEQVLAAARELARERRSTVGIVVARRIAPGIAPELVEVGCASADLVPAESYCVYRLPFSER
jgi:hypothetical protein